MKHPGSGFERLANPRLFLSRLPVGAAGAILALLSACTYRQPLLVHVVPCGCPAEHSAAAFSSSLPRPQSPGVFPLAAGDSAGKGALDLRTAPPFATMVLNGHPMGEAPARFQLPPGEYRLEVIHRLHPPRDTVLRVRAGEEKKVKVDLEP